MQDWLNWIRIEQCSKPPSFLSAQFLLWDRACEVMTKEEILPSICLISAKYFLSARETSRENSSLDCVPYCQSRTAKSELLGLLC